MALPPIIKALGTAATPPLQAIPTPTTVVVPTPPAPTTIVDKVKGWVANPADKATIMKHASQHDWLKAHGGQDIADRIFRNAPENQNLGAAQSTTYAKNAGDEELRLTYDTVDKYSGMNSLWTTLVLWKRKPALLLRRQLEDETYRYLVQSYYRESQGLPVLNHADPRIQDIADSYRKSKFASNSLTRQEASGIDVSDIRQSDNYAPVHWEHHKIVKFTRNEDSAIDDVANAFGSQIIRQFPKLAEKGLSAQQVGRSFLQTQRDAATNTSATPFHGTTISDMENILRNAGIEEAEISQVIQHITPDMKDAGKNKHHKSRMAFDIDEVFFDKKQRPFRLGDFMRTNLSHQLDTYNNVMAHRIGLAKSGFPDETSLRSAFNDITKQYEGDAAKYKEVSETLETMFNDAMGRPTGAAMADTIRSGTTIAQSLFLKRAGLFNIVDYHRSLQRFGYAKVMTKFLPAFKGVLKSQPMTPGIARRLDDIIASRLVHEGRMRSVINLTEDNFAGAVTLGHEWIRTAGQTTKFLNMSEWLRRHHINIVVSCQADYLNQMQKAFGKGELTGEAADAYKYLTDIGMDDAMITRVQKEMDNHGLYTDNWKDQDLADDMGTMLSSSVDDFAIMVRRGELPPVLAYSSVGKILFPFFTFTAATNQKILRQNYNAGGVPALAIMMAHQAPLAMLVASAANVMDGKEWDEDVLKRAVGIAPGLGYGAFAYSAFDRGEVGSTPTVWALPNAAANISKALVEGDVSGVVKNIPGISASPVIQTLNNALNE